MPQTVSPSDGKPALAVRVVLHPTLFYDKDGKLWMTYGSWSGSCRPLTGDLVLRPNGPIIKTVHIPRRSRLPDFRVGGVSGF